MNEICQTHKSWWSGQFIFNQSFQCQICVWYFSRVKYRIILDYHPWKLRTKYFCERVKVGRTRLREHYTARSCRNVGHTDFFRLKMHFSFRLVIAARRSSDLWFHRSGFPYRVIPSHFINTFLLSWEVEAFLDCFSKHCNILLKAVFTRTVSLDHLIKFSALCIRQLHLLTIIRSGVVLCSIKTGRLCCGCDLWLERIGSKPPWGDSQDAESLMQRSHQSDSAVMMNSRGHLWWPLNSRVAWHSRRLPSAGFTWTTWCFMWSASSKCRKYQLFIIQGQ